MGTEWSVYSASLPMYVIVDSGRGIVFADNGIHQTRGSGLETWYMVATRRWSLSIVASHYLGSLMALDRPAGFFSHETCSPRDREATSIPRIA